MGIGKVLDRHIRSAGRSVTDVAKAAGVKPSTLQSTIDRDGGSSCLHLVQVTRELGLTVEQLFEEAGAIDTAISGLDATSAGQTGRPGDAAHIAAARAYDEPRTGASKAWAIPGDRSEDTGMFRISGNGFSEVSRPLLEFLRSRIWYLRVNTAGLYSGAAKGDILVVARRETVRTGDTGIYRWDDRCYVCVAGADALIVQGPDHWSRPLTWPSECLGKVIGVLKPPAVQSAENSPA